MDLNIGKGVKQFNINGAVTVEFNPTDVFFVENLYRAFSELDKKNEERKAVLQNLDTEQAFTLARNVDREMRDTIDTLFGVKVCDPVFGDMNMYAMADGATLWENLMYAVIEQCDNSMAEERLKENPKIKKYLQKYKNK